MVTSIFPLAVEAAVVRKRGVRLLGPIDLSLTGEGLTVVIGPNGSGKTTFLRLLHGLERPREGAVRWAAPTSEARTRQAFVFQTPIMMRRSVRDCIAYPLILRGSSRADARRAAERAAADIGLDAALDLSAQTISGGEKQKLAIARALIAAPDVLFLDEPCASLDGRATREIEDALQKARARGVRIVMSTHDMGQARRLADDVLFLARGELREAAAADRFFTAPESSEAQAFLDGRIVE